VATVNDSNKNVAAATDAAKTAAVLVAVVSHAAAAAAVAGLPRAHGRGRRLHQLGRARGGRRPREQLQKHLGQFKSKKKKKKEN